MKTLSQFLFEENQLFPHEHVHDNETFKNSNPEFYQIMDHHFPNNRAKNSGGGVYGQAFTLHPKHEWDDSERDAHTIIKVSKGNKSDYRPGDGYKEHVLHSAQSSDRNPHLPRVYKTTTYKTAGTHDGDEGEMNVHEMEKLHSLHNVEPHELDAAYNHAFPGSDRLKFGNVSPYRVAEHVKTMARTFYDKNLLRTPRETREDYGASPHLLAATKAVHQTMQKRNLSNADLHDQNIMIRKTHVGPQLVITDPVI